MKKSLLLFLVLLPAMGFCQALSGTYIVGATQAAPFNTLTNAVAKINLVGVAGPVVFLLDNTDYSSATGESFPIKISQFSGSSAANTLRIKPNTGKTVTITANPNGSGYTGVAAALQLDGADNIIIDGSNTTNGTTRNLTIINNDNVSYLARTAVWISSNTSNGATNISVLNTKLKMVNRNQDQLLFSGIYSGSNSLGTNNTINVAAATAANSQLNLTNDEFLNVRQGIYIAGNSSASLQTGDVQIVSNVLGSTVDAEKPSRTIYLSNITNFNITDNTISGVLNSSYADQTLSAIEIDNGSSYTIQRNVLTDVKLTTNAIIGYAVWIKGVTTNGIISENKISNIKNTGNGLIRVLSLEIDANTTSNLLVANNFLSDIASTGSSSNTAHGIYISSGKAIRLYYNSVAMNASQPGWSAALYVNGGSELDVRDNIFFNSSNTSTRYAVYSNVAATAFTSLDYNDYYSQPIGYLGSDRTTLAAWKTATGKDVHSVNIAPVFTSTSDLHLLAASNATLDNLGTPLAAVPLDIDNYTRSTTQPDMGADEFFVPPVPAAEPTVQSSAITFTNVTYSGFTVNWTNGNGAKRILLIRSGSAVTSPPVDGSSYTAQAAFGSGSLIGSGNYAVYSGSGTSVVVTGLSAATTYYVALYDFNGAAGTENYLTTNPATGNRLTLNAPLGWQILAPNAINTITFDTTVAGVNNNSFQALGISPLGQSGQLDSRSWAITGFSDAAIPFGGTNVANQDYDRGASAGGVTTGGVYAFQTVANNSSLGIQPANGDFSPGSISLRFQNQTASAITSISFGYKAYIYNDENASSSFNFSHSADNVTYTAVPELNVTSPAAADANPGWKASYRVATITGLNIAPNSYYYVRWTGATVSGSTDFDEFALDDIELSANPTTNYATFDGTADNFVVDGNANLSGNTTVSTNLTFSNGKLGINGNTLTLGGAVVNTVTGGLKGSATSNITINGSNSPSLSFDQSTPGTTNLLNNFTLSFSAPKTVSLLNAVVVNGTLSVGLDQVLNLGTTALTGTLATTTINGTLRTQNTTTGPLPSGKTWAGTGTVSYDAVSTAQTVVGGTYNNLTIASTAGATANAALTVNGVLNLTQANPSATQGSLALGTYVLTMGGDATNTGTGDVTGVTTRNTIVANTLYTFGHPNISILFPNTGTLPTSMSLKTTIGAAPSWLPGAVNRVYDFIQTGGSGTKAVIQAHYLDSELNGNAENKLVDFAHIFSSNTTLEQGRSNYNTSDNWIELTNINVGLYFTNTFGAVQLTFDESAASLLTWNGSVSTSWTTAANWTPNATPSDNTVVFIPDAATTPNDPTLNPADLLGSMDIAVGGIVNAPDNSQLTMNNAAGAWINNGTYNPGAGTSRVIFTNADATMAGNTNFNNITINAGAGVRPLTGNSMHIAGVFSQLGSFSAGAIDNTVEYTGTNQAIAVPTGALVAYNNLTISGTGAVFPASLNITGDLNLNQVVDFTGKTIVLNGSDLQTIGGSSAPVFNNLTINNSGGGAILTSNTKIAGTLTLTAGSLLIGNFDLTLGAAAVAGTFSAANMIVTDGSGMVKRPFTTTGSYFFPIGEHTSNAAYSPISVNMTAGTFSGSAVVGVSVVDATHPDNHSTQNYISRYWNVKQTGITGAVATITANYIAPEVLTPESTMVAAQLTGTFNQQTNPWVRYQALNNLTLTAVGAPLTAGQISAFTGIKGGSFTAQITGYGTFCHNEEVTLDADTTGGDGPFAYLWSGGLGTDDTATAPTSALGTTAYTLTVKDGNGITASDTENVTTLAEAIVGTVSANQTECFGYEPDDITLSGNTGNIVGWQRSDNPSFDNPVEIATTSATLTGQEAGAVTVDTYFRAEIANGDCPVVYSNTATVFVKSTVWNGSSWSNGVPDGAVSAIIMGDYSEAASISACSLTVLNNATVLIPSGFDVVLNGALTVASGSFTLENNSNIDQLTNETNFGNSSIKRSSSPLFRFDYTMWSSPVTNGQSLHDFSPLTLDNRFYTLNTTTNLFAICDPNANSFQQGKGYLIRMPNNHVLYGDGVMAESWEGTFTGIAGNGDVALPLDTTGQRYNMVGNPYPSMIDADSFLDLNQNNINGTIYFWRRRNNPPVDGELTSAYYATYTAAGGVGVDPVATASDTSQIPNGFIQVGQGFIVKAATVPQNGSVLFNNTIRTVANNDGQFFRTQTITEKSRIWLNVTNANGAFGQTLIAYLDNGLNEVDRTDGEYMNDGTFALTSYLNDAEYIIQGRAPFTVSDVVPLNFKTPNPGTYTISIDHTDGLFNDGQDIFLRDNLDDLTYDIKAAPYVFTSEAGNFNSRFEVVYQNALGTTTPIATRDNMIVFKKDGNIVVNTGTKIMSSVSIYDIRGRLLLQKTDINAAETSIQDGMPQQVLLLQATFKDGSVISKKFVN